MAPVSGACVVGIRDMRRRSEFVMIAFCQSIIKNDDDDDELYCTFTYECVSKKTLA